MKILFLVVRKGGPSARWRVEQFLPYFRDAKHDCTLEELQPGMFARLAQAKRAAKYDLVMVQRRLLPRLVFQRLRRNAKALVYEVNDMVMFKRKDNALVASRTRERRLRRMIRAADALIVGHEALANKMRNMGVAEDRLHILPSVIDLSKWGPRKPAEGTAKRVGWVGAPSNLGQLDLLAQPLRRVCRDREDLKVGVVCDEPWKVENVPTENKPYSVDEEVDDLAKFDIGLSPFVEDAMSRGRGANNVLAYFASGLPVVASNVVGNREYIRQGENGYLCGTLAEWEERLEELIESPERRTELGRAARDLVEKEYSLERMVPKYLELFEQVVSARAR